MLCLTGEGVTLSVSRSVLGSDLCRVVSKDLSCQARSSSCIVWMESWPWMSSWKTNGLLEKHGKTAMLPCTTDINWCEYSLALCLWAPKLCERERGRVCARGCYTSWKSNERRMFASSPLQPCKAWVLALISTKACSWWPCHRVFKALVLLVMTIYHASFLLVVLAVLNLLFAFSHRYRCKRGICVWVWRRFTERI